MDRRLFAAGAGAGSGGVCGAAYGECSGGVCGGIGAAAAFQRIVPQPVTQNPKFFGKGAWGENLCFNKGFPPISSFEKARHKKASAKRKHKRKIK